MHDLSYVDSNANDWTYIPSRRLVSPLKWVREYPKRLIRDVGIKTSYPPRNPR